MTDRLRRTWGSAAIAAVFAVGSVSGCGSPAAAPSLNRVAWGLVGDGGTSTASIVSRSKAVVGYPATVVERFVSLDLRPEAVDALVASFRTGSDARTTTVLTLEPGNGQNRRTTLSDIAAGRADQELTNIARLLSTFPGEVALRFAHEPNGNWYAWAGRPQPYLRAWRRVATRVRAVDHAVRLVWSVTADDRPASNALESYWPGRDEVDVIGVDGYNCLDGWRSPRTIFTSVVTRLRTLAPQAPIWLTETATCEASQVSGPPPGSSKATWIRELGLFVDSAGIRVVVWFDRRKEYDWTITSSAATGVALGKMLTDSGTAR